MLLSCGGALFGGRGHNILLSLRVNHKENKFPSVGNDLIAFLHNDQRDGGRQYYLWYPVQLITQSNNKVQGLELSTTCQFYKYGWPNNTSQTSRGAASHSTSYVKGLML